MKIKLNIRLKITTALLGLLSITILTGTLLVLNQNEVLLKKKYHNRLKQLIRNTAHSLTEPMLNENDLRVATLISAFKKEIEAVEVQVFDITIGKIIASTNLYHLGQIPDTPINRQITKNRGRLITLQQQDTLIYSFPISIRNFKLGDLIVKTSQQREASILQQDLRPTYHTILWVSLLSLVLGIIGVLILTRQILKPLETLMLGIQRISRGDMNYRIQLTTRDEFEQVANAFNQMLEIIESKEEEIIEFNRQLEKRIEQAVKHSLELEKQIAETERMASVGRLAASIAHELNNPLASILMYARLTEENLTDETAKKNVQKIIRNTLRARNTIKDLVDYTRYSKLERKPVDLQNMIEFVLQKFESDFKQQNIVVELHSEVKTRVSLDTRHFERVLVNLIQNAMDAMPEGGQLRFELKEKRSEVEIRVSDTGKGIPAKNLKKIFEPFFSTKEMGTGLGLFLSYEIVRAHGGRIKVKNLKPKGTLFIISIPKGKNDGN